MSKSTGKLILDGLASGYSTPNDTSSCSSDYDGFGMMEEFDNFFQLSDSFVSEIFDNSVTGISELDRESSVESPSKVSTVSSYNPGTSSHRNAVDYLLSSKLWSHMSPEEQLNTLHALSEVTYHMGLSEQMDIIKIIDPTAIIAPDCKEFALDSTNFDDSKLKKIINFVIKQRLHVKNSSQSLNNFSLSSKNQNSSSSKLLSRKNNSVTYARTKRKSQKRTMEAASNVQNSSTSGEYGTDNVKTTAEYECSICLESAQGKEMKTLPCSHAFHQECIDEWVKTKETCPLCRKETGHHQNAGSSARNPALPDMSEDSFVRYVLGRLLEED